MRRVPCRTNYSMVFRKPPAPTANTMLQETDFSNDFTQKHDAVPSLFCVFPFPILQSILRRGTTPGCLARCGHHLKIRPTTKAVGKMIWQQSDRLSPTERKALCYNVVIKKMSTRCLPNTKTVCKLIVYKLIPFHINSPKPKKMIKHEQLLRCHTDP